MLARDLLEISIVVEMENKVFFFFFHLETKIGVFVFIQAASWLRL
jgi:hypothetical protein